MSFQALARGKAQQAALIDQTTGFGLPPKRRAGRRYVLFAIFGVGYDVPTAPMRRFTAGTFGCWSSFFGGEEGKGKRRRNI